MSRNAKESLFSRWSRLKRESVAEHGEPTAAASRQTERADDENASGRPRVGPEHRAKAVGGDGAPCLPSIEELGPDSDYQAFMDPGVDEDTRRAALKTLFRDPAFNVTDGLDVYAEDYSKLETLAPAIAATLRYVQRNLSGREDASEHTSTAERAEAGEDSAATGVDSADVDHGSADNKTKTAADHGGSRGDEPGDGDGGQHRNQVTADQSSADQTGEAVRNRGGTRGS